jgi:hypothetical protein
LCSLVRDAADALQLARAFREPKQGSEAGALFASADADPAAGRRRLAAQAAGQAAPLVPVADLATALDLSRVAPGVASGVSLLAGGEVALADLAPGRPAREAFLRHAHAAGLVRTDTISHAANTAGYLY